MGFSALLASADRSVRGILGDAVTYTPSAGSPVSVKGIFDSAYVRADVGDPGISTSGPALFVTLADLPADPETDYGATVTVGAVVYQVHEVKPDGQGGAVLLLHRTA